jgi:hypothetical protein
MRSSPGICFVRTFARCEPIDGGGKSSPSLKHDIGCRSQSSGKRQCCAIGHGEYAAERDCRAE